MSWEDEKKRDREAKKVKGMVDDSTLVICGPNDWTALSPIPGLPRVWGSDFDHHKLERVSIYTCLLESIAWGWRLCYAQHIAS